MIAAGVEVVGRTRFCIHPADQVKKIPALGGTKAITWDNTPDCDLVIFDKEENNKEMAEQCPYPYYALHVESLETLTLELFKLAELLKNSFLKELALRSKKITENPVVLKENLDKFPGVLMQNRGFKNNKKLCYLIWKDPYMSVSKNTFIGSVLLHLGYEKFLQEYEEKYPKLKEVPGIDTSLLLSSEPYPFEREWKKNYQNDEQGAALVDGEAFSWFGIRSIEFLENAIEGSSAESI